MSVRTWFTLSALVLVALGIAFAVRIFSPVGAPEILASAGDVSLEGYELASCWPQRGGEARCRTTERDDDGPYTTIPSTGTLRILAAFPVQPDDGSVIVTDGSGQPVIVSSWTREIDYDLDTGSYELLAEGRYTDGGNVTYRFFFSVS